MNQSSFSLAICSAVFLTTGYLAAAILGPITYTNTGNAITIDRYSDEVDGAVVIPETIEGKPVTVIGTYAFSGCSNLTEVTLPEGITRIESYAFLNCEEIQSLNIPQGVTTIGDGAFFGADQLVEMRIPPGVTEIGAYTFEECSNLESVEIPSGVTRIGRYAFFGCDSLSRVTFPSSITSIDDYAFWKCDSCENVTFLGNAPSMGVGVFENGMTVYSSPGSTGFTYPKWLGYFSEFIPLPIIAVVSADEKILKNGKGKQQFGSVKVGKKSKPMIYGIVNVGNLTLSDLLITKSGVDQADFKIATSRDKSLEGGEYVVFKVVFSPKKKGLRKASLHIKSNDSKNPSFKINLNGTGR